MKNRLLSILFHPAFLAMVISLLIIYFLPDYFTKYKVELVEQNQVGKNQRIFFHDLNGDHKSEKIVTQTNKSNNASFIIYNDMGNIMDQWNFPKKYALKKRVIQFYDLDKNGYSEIYFVTQNQDSAFFNSIEPLNKVDNKNSEIFMDTIGAYNNEYPISSVKFMFDDKTSKDKKEVFLNINSGFSGYPRNTYKINTVNRTVVKSPYLTNHSSISSFADLDGDGINEMLITNGSSCNKIDSTITSRSDYSSWLMVLDKNLKFLFEPVEFKNPYSGVVAFPIKNKNEDCEILCLSKSRQENIIPDKLYIFSKLGKVIQEETLPKGEYYLILEPNKNEFSLFNKANGFVQTYNYNFEKLTSFFIEPKSIVYSLDIDKDDKTEFLVKYLTSNEITIYQNYFEDPVKFQIPNFGKGTLDYGLKEVGEKENEIFFRNGSDYYVYKYGKNPLYIFRFLIYLGIFLLIFTLVWIARKGQKIQMEKQIAIEKEISALQIKTLKNQVDPHFVFNAVNTISDMLLTDDKLEADRFISKFSKLMRETLKKSDKITTTLQEELDYVENYIQLQRTRFSDKFNYQIKKGLNVDYNTAVPNHVIYSYVENAIKHGLSGRKDGLLIITVASKDESIIISIENNGGGMNHTNKTKRNSTGNGLIIMEKIYSLYEKLYHKKITHRLTEIKDNQGIITGVSVEIKITK